MARFPVKFVAEIGINHNGSIETAKKLIDMAAWCGADYVKFQKRDVEGLPDSVKQRPRTDPGAYGPTEYEHRRRLEFSFEQLTDLKHYASNRGVGFACSAWDNNSYRQLCDLGLDYIKIPSAKNQEFLSWDRLSEDMIHHVSFGMTSQTMAHGILMECQEKDIEVIPYSCLSKYPHDSSEATLAEITRLKRYNPEVGFSGHHKGIALDVVARVLGAAWFERHITLDRSSRGSDHAASLEVDGLRRLIRDLKIVDVCMGDKPMETIPDSEIAAWKKFKGV